MRRFPLVEVGAVSAQRTLAIAHDDMVAPDPHRLDQFGAGDRRRPGAVDHDLDVAQRAPRQVTGVDQPGGGDDRGAVLVVVKHRDVHPLAQCLFDHETIGRSDIFQVDPAEARAEQRHRVDEFLGILGVDLKIDRVDVGEAFEQHRLALHHRLRRQGAQIAEPEDGGAVGNHRDEVALGGIIIGFRRISGDFLDRDGDAGGIGQAEVALGRHRLRGDDLDLARPPARMKFERFVAREFDVAVAQVGLPVWRP